MKTVLLTTKSNYIDTLDGLLRHNNNASTIDAWHKTNDADNKHIIDWTQEEAIRGHDNHNNKEHVME